MSGRWPACRYTGWDGELEGAMFFLELVVAIVVGKFLYDFVVGWGEGMGWWR